MKSIFSLHISEVIHNEVQSPISSFLDLVQIILEDLISFLSECKLSYSMSYQVLPYIMMLETLIVLLMEKVTWITKSIIHRMS